MALITSQQIQRYYDQYARAEVIFNREVIKATLLYPKQIYLKCLGFQWPCILYSCSMTGAKVIVNVQSAFKQEVTKSNNTVSLRYSFIQREKADPLAFFVPAKIIDYTPYSPDNPELNFVNLSFTSRVPDDLIERLGILLDAQNNAQNRREERIIMNAETIKELGINARDVTVSIDHIPRKCIIRDLAFSGVKLIIMGVPKFLVGKETVMRLKVENPDEILELKGKVVRFEAIEGRQDIGAFAIHFYEESIPMDYKLRLSNYFKQQKTKSSPKKA